MTSKNLLINVCFSWEILRIATYVDGARRLIDPNVVDAHGSGESNMRKIHKAEIHRDTQIQNNVLGGRTNFNDKMSRYMSFKLTMGSCGIGR